MLSIHATVSRLALFSRETRASHGFLTVYSFYTSPSTKSVSLYDTCVACTLWDVIVNGPSINRGRRWSLLARIRVKSLRARRTKTEPSPRSPSSLPRNRRPLVMADCVKHTHANPPTHVYNIVKRTHFKYDDDDRATANTLLILARPSLAFSSPRHISHSSRITR